MFSVQYSIQQILKPLLYTCVSLCLTLSVQADEDTQIATNENESLTSQKIPGPLAVGFSAQQMDFEPVAGSDAEMALDRTTLKLAFGKFNIGHHILVPGLTVDRMGFRFKNAANDDTETYTIKTPLTFIKRSDEQWTRIVSITPSLHSDLELYDEEAFSLMGLVLWKYKHSATSSWTFGGGVNRLFGVYKPVPMFSYRYQPIPNLAIDLGFPRTGIENRFVKNWSAFAGVGPVGGNWRYQTPDEKRFNIAYTSWVATTGLRYQLRPKLWLTAEAGKTFERKLDLNQGSESDSVDVGDSHFILLSFGIRP